jgi:hypothetical protein
MFTKPVKFFSDTVSDPSFPQVLVKQLKINDGSTACVSDDVFQMLRHDSWAVEVVASSVKPTTCRSRL